MTATESRRRLVPGVLPSPGAVPRRCAGRAGLVWPDRWLRLAAASLAAAVVLALAGCGNRQALHSALRVMDEDIDRGAHRGSSLISRGGAPEDVFESRIVDANMRVSSSVILRTAACSYPADLIAYEVTKRGDASPSGVRRSAMAGVKRAEKEMICLATVQLPKTRDPAEVQFALRTNTGVEYPPMVVDTPTLLRDINPGYYDPSSAPAGLYRYVIHFPIRGGPGVPPVGPGVGSVSLVVRADEGEALVPFTLRSREP